MKYKSEIYEVVHQSAVEKFKIGAICEARMREYDRMCLAEESAATPAPDFFHAEPEPAEMERVTA